MKYFVVAPYEHHHIITSGFHPLLQVTLDRIRALFTHTAASPIQHIIMTTK